MRTVLRNYRLRTLLYIIGIEWLFFGGWYLLSSDGIRAIVRLKRECGDIERQVKQLESEVLYLQRECTEWRSCPFYVERYARKKLSMSYPGDEILLV